MSIRPCPLKTKHKSLLRDSKPDFIFSLGSNFLCATHIIPVKNEEGVVMMFILNFDYILDEGSSDSLERLNHTSPSKADQCEYPLGKLTTKPPKTFLQPQTTIRLKKGSLVEDRWTRVVNKRAISHYKMISSGKKKSYFCCCWDCHNTTFNKLGTLQCIFHNLTFRGHNFVFRYMA